MQDALIATPGTNALGSADGEENSGCFLVSRRAPGEARVAATVVLVWAPEQGSFQVDALAPRDLYPGDYALVGGASAVRLRPAEGAGGQPVHALGIDGELLNEIVRELQSVSRSSIELMHMMKELTHRPIVDRQPAWLIGLLGDLDRAARLGLRDPAWLLRHARLIWERLIFSRAVRRPARPTRARPSARRSGLNQRLRRVRELIESEYHRPLDLSQMASVACVSRYHFLREFRKTYGRTPYQMLIEIRLKAARRMLRDGDLSVQEIGRRVGFASSDGFYRAFRRRFSSSPTSFRLAG